MEPIRLREFTVELGGVYERVVRAQHDSRIRGRQCAEAINECVLERPGGLDRVVALADVEADAFAIGAIKNRVEIDKAVPARPNVCSIRCPTHVRNRDDADARFDAWRAAFLKPAMTLPAFDLHDPLHGFAINGEVLHAKTCPHHSIAEIRLSIDHMLDPLRENVVDNHGSFAPLVIRRASRDI